MRLNGCCASAATGASHCAWPSRASAAICFRRAIRASHGERSNTVSAASSMQVRLLVMAKARSQLADGISRVQVSARPAPRRASSPSALQVMSRKRASSTSLRTRSTAATLSGLEPLRPNETSRVGRSRCRYSAGWVSRLVVCTTRTSAGHCALIASATISAMKPELPAPVNSTRWLGSLRLSPRKACRRSRARDRSCARASHSAGCWAISVAVSAPPRRCQADTSESRVTSIRRFQLGQRTICVFFRNVKHRK